jgi:hypothetical protein
MVFHRPEGDEVFRLKWALLKAIKHPEGFELSFSVCAEKGSVTPPSDTAELQAQPNADVSVFVDEFDPTTTTTKTSTGS